MSRIRNWEGFSRDGRRSVIARRPGRGAAPNGTPTPGAAPLDLATGAVRLELVDPGEDGPIHHDVGPTHERGVVGGQEQRDTGDLVR